MPGSPSRCGRVRRPWFRTFEPDSLAERLLRAREPRLHDLRVCGAGQGAAIVPGSRQRRRTPRPRLDLRASRSHRGRDQRGPREVRARRHGLDPKRPAGRREDALQDLPVDPPSGSPAVNTSAASVFTARRTSPASKSARSTVVKVGGVTCSVDTAPAKAIPVPASCSTPNGLRGVKGRARTAGFPWCRTTRAKRSATTPASAKRAGCFRSQERLTALGAAECSESDVGWTKPKYGHPSRSAAAASSSGLSEEAPGPGVATSAPAFQGGQVFPWPAAPGRQPWCTGSAKPNRSASPARSDRSG